MRFLPGCFGVSFLSVACGPSVASRPPDPETTAIILDQEEGNDPLGIEYGHLPPPGECRLWFPDQPPGQQPPPGRCDQIEPEAPAGAWVLYRPKDNLKLVHSRVIDPRRDGVVLFVRVYDAERGTFLRRERP